MAYRDRTSTWALFLYAFLLLTPLGLWSCAEYKVSLELEQNCTGHLLRAAHSNTIETARAELEQAVHHLEINNLTDGYTSIFESLRTPDEDIRFWYLNLCGALDQLRKSPKDISPLERSNVLLKLRESLVRTDNRGDHVICPAGLARYPSNVAWIVTLIAAGLMAAGGFGLGMYACTRI